MTAAYATEAELCADFIEWAERHGYKAYAETGGWDVLLVDKSGHQIGVEAKLRLNMKVISQAIPECYNCGVGPDHRAILVPQLNDAVDILEFMGIAVFYGGRSTREQQTWRRFSPEFHRHLAWHIEMQDWNPKRRHELPEFVPDVAAGVASPVKLTPWKVGALKILAHLELKGEIDRSTIRDYGCDPRRWAAADGWLRPVDGRRGYWSRGSAPAFDEQHPGVYAEIKQKLAEALI